MSRRADGPAPFERPRAGSAAFLIDGDVCHWGQLMAASVITAIPVVVRYVFIALTTLATSILWLPDRRSARPDSAS